MFSQIKFYGVCVFALIVLVFTWDYKRMKKTIVKQKAQIKGHEVKEEIVEGDKARTVESREKEKTVKGATDANLLDEANNTDNN